MDKTIKKYCEENSISGTTGWRRFKSNKIPGAYQDSNGRIYIRENIKEEVKTSETIQSQAWQAQLSVKNSDISLMQDILPLDTSLEEGGKTSKAATTRLNRSAFTEEFNRFNNIDTGYLPYSYGSGGSSSNISVRDTIILTQKAYFNFPVVRNIIDMMTEFSSSKIYLTGGNETSRKFFYSYFNAININNFQDRFFREFYRSGNVFIYPLKIKLRKQDVNEWIKQFKLNQSIAAKSINLAARYIILNPADLEISGSSSFIMATYYKRLTPYEIKVLRDPKTDEDKRIFDNLPQDIQQQIRKGDTEVLVPLNTDSIFPIFYKKQDYEPFSVPMIFPVLDDIEWKSELKKIDKAISRTVQQAVLLVTVGYETKDGKYAVSKDMITSLRDIFKNESVGRVLVNDFTTKAQFVIPQVGDILDPKKYQIVNEDIRNGLNDILMGGVSGEKFANQSIKVKVFLGRLRQAREVFLNDFLIPEIKYISELLGFKSYPEPKFEDIDLEESVEWTRAVTRLGEIGFLTPEETLNSIESGRLPSMDESIESQKKFKELKDQGYYQPIVGGTFDKKELAKVGKQSKIQELSKENGRPAGSNTPQSTKKISPLSAEIKFSAQKVKDNIILADKLQKSVNKYLCKKFKLKKLQEEQENISKELSELIIANEIPDKWEDSIENYASNPIDKNQDRVTLLNEISVSHNLDNFLAGILLNSIIEEKK